MPVEKRAGESKDSFISRCIAKEISSGKDQDQAAAICYGIWSGGFNEPAVSIEFETYNDYPESASNNAKRALEIRDEVGIDCGTAVGWQRANQLAKKENISADTIGRMAAFARHEQNSAGDPKEDCGALMWLAWGGDSGINWAKSKIESIRNQDLKFALGERVSFDWDGTLSTARGQQLAKKEINEGSVVYIVSARDFIDDNMRSVADSLMIPNSRIYTVGSNKSKVEKVRELRIRKHYDNNIDVVRELGRVGLRFFKDRILFSHDSNKEDIKKYLNGDYEVHLLSDTSLFNKQSKAYQASLELNIPVVYKKDSVYDLDFTEGDPIMTKLSEIGEPRGRVLASKKIDTFDQIDEIELELRKLVDLKLAKVEVRFTYDEIPGIPPAKSGSRRFCRRILASNKQYKREEIQNLNNGFPQLGDVFLYRGGFYNNPDTGVTTPYCRHMWNLNLVMV